MSNLALAMFKVHVESLSWDEFNSLYEEYENFDKERKKILKEEKAKRSQNFNNYMSF